MTTTTSCSFVREKFQCVASLLSLLNCMFFFIKCSILTRLDLVRFQLMTFNHEQLFEFIDCIVLRLRQVFHRHLNADVFGIDNENMNQRIQHAMNTTSNGFEDKFELLSMY
jgi:hypothetical protein